MHPIPTAEVARILGVSKRTVHRLVEAEQLHPIIRAPGPNGAMMFDPEEVRQIAHETRTVAS